MVEVDGDLGGIPVVGDADDGLSGFSGKLEGGSEGGEEEKEEDAAHRGYWVTGY